MALEAEKIEYILGVRERTSREVRAEIIEDDGLAVPLAHPAPERRDRTGDQGDDNRRTALYHLPQRGGSQKGRRGARRTVVGLERKLAQGDKALVANKGFRRFLKTPQGDGFVIDRAKVEADARFDGLFVLRTNTKISALQVVLRYRNLLAVEDAFKTAKALLATRPIFHKTDAGIRGHVFCTFLALVLRKELIDRLAARHSRLEWQRIVDDLADLSEIEIEQDGRRALLRTAPGPTIDPICRAIGLTLPPVFQEVPPASLTPNKLWCLKPKMASQAIDNQPSFKSKLRKLGQRCKQIIIGFDELFKRIFKSIIDAWVAGTTITEENRSRDSRSAAADI